jgi:hypothetical protein
LARRSLLATRGTNSAERNQLMQKYNEIFEVEKDNYSSHLYSQSQWKAENVKEIKPIYSDSSEDVDGRVVVRNNFDKIFEKYPETLVFGEDAGNIGDVNQGLKECRKNTVTFVLLIQEFVKLQFLDKELVWR